MQEDGKPLRDHLNSLWRQTGVQPQLLEEAPALPPLVSHLWEWFLDLCNERENNGMAISRISSRAIRDWCWASGNQTEVWERKALRRLDAAWVRAQNVN